MPAKNGTPKNTTQKNNGVYLACASVNTGVAWEDFISNLLGFQHCWIQTPQKKAGLGPAKPGPLPNCPLGIPTAITDQSDHKPDSMTPLPKGYSGHDTKTQLFSTRGTSDGRQQ